MAFTIVKSWGMGHESLKTVGKTCRINLELGEFSLLTYVKGLLWHETGELKQLNGSMPKVG